MSPERIVYDINESFQTIDSEDIATTSNFQDGGRSSNSISWSFVWVNRYIVLKVSTTFQPVINFVRVKAVFCLIALDLEALHRNHRCKLAHLKLFLKLRR